MPWFLRFRLVLAILGGVLTLLAAFAGGFFMALGNASDSGGDDPPPPCRGHSRPTFQALLVAAGLAIACAFLMHRWPRMASLLGFGAVGLGVAANVICTYDVGACVSAWLVVTLPVVFAAVLGLFGNGTRGFRGGRRSQRRPVHG